MRKKVMALTQQLWAVLHLWGKVSVSINIMKSGYKLLVCMGLVLLFGINPYAKAQSPSEMFREHVPGAGLYNTGKAMVWTGAGIALSGGALLLYAQLDHSLFRNPNAQGVDDLSPLVALTGAGIGAGTALIGSILMFAGNEHCVRSEGHGLKDQLVTIDPTSGRGQGLMMEVGGSIYPIVHARVVAGYHFNRHVFLGGGASAAYDRSVFGPFAGFVNARFSFTDKKVAPFFGLDLGGAALEKNISLYSGFQAGARIHRDEAHSCWVSAYSDYAPSLDHYFSYGLRFGYSF